MHNKRGPNTPEGKARSSQNAVKHGLLSSVVLLYHEDAEELNAHAAKLRERYQPVGYDEELLVDRIIAGYWQLRRAFRAETAAMNTCYNSSLANSEGGDYLPEVRDWHATATMVANEPFDRVQRYGAQIERRLHRAIQDLQCLQAARKTGAPPVYDAVRYTMNLVQPEQTAPEPGVDGNRGFDQTNSGPETPRSPDRPADPAMVSTAEDAREPVTPALGDGHSHGQRLEGHPNNPGSVGHPDIDAQRLRQGLPSPVS